MTLLVDEAVRCFERVFAEAPDRTVVTDPEPCDDCDTGIAYMVCYDGVRRCRNCVHALAALNGWDQPPNPPEPPEPTPAPVVPPPPPPSPRAMKKALKEEAEMIARDVQGVML